MEMHCIYHLWTHNKLHQTEAACGGPSKETFVEINSLTLLSQQFVVSENRKFRQDNFQD